MSTKDRIIAESLRLFNLQGKAQVGVREIARALEISPGNLSYHFPRKEDLLQYHFSQYQSELSILMQAYLEEEEDLYRFLELLRSCLGRQHAYRGLFHEVSEELDGQLDIPEMSNRVQLSIPKLVRQGQLQLSDEDSVFLSGVIIFHLKFWLVGIPLNQDPTAREELIRYYLSTILRLLLMFASPNGRINLLRFKATLIR